MRPNKSYTHRPSPFADLVNEKRLAQNKYYADKMRQSQSAPVSPAKPATIAPVTPETPKMGKLYLRVRSLESKEAKRAMAIVSIFQYEEAAATNSPVFFYETETGKYLSRSDMKTVLSDFVVVQLKKILGDENVIVK